MPLSPQERDTAIRTIIGEAGNQGYAGQVAVANVINNRAQSGSFPSSWGGVIMQPGQFSVWNDTTGYAGGQQGATARMMAIDPNSAQYQRVGAIVDGVSSGQIPDNTGGATHYYNPNVSQPRWGLGNPSWQSTGNVGAHTFGIANSSGDGRGGIPESAWSNTFTLDQSRAQTFSPGDFGDRGMLSGTTLDGSPGGTGWMGFNDGFGSYQQTNLGGSVPMTWGGADQNSWAGYGSSGNPFMATGESGQDWYGTSGSSAGMYGETNARFSGGSTLGGAGTSTSSGWQDVGSYNPETGEWNTSEGGDGSAQTPAQQQASTSQSQARSIAQGSGSTQQGQGGNIPQAIVTAANQIAQQQQKAADYEARTTTSIVGNVINFLTNLFSRAVVIILGFIFVAAGLSMFSKGTVIASFAGGVRDGMRGKA